jgi:hypothetical protein
MELDDDLQGHCRTPGRGADRGCASGSNPDQPFPKDVSLVRVSGFKITFESGMVLVGSHEDLRERVNIRPDDAAVPGVDIDDAIKKLRGR